MASIIIELGLGYLLTYKVPGILNTSKNVSLGIKIVGIIFLIVGFVDLVHKIVSLLQIS